MMSKPNCLARECKHFLGVIGFEPNQRVICSAFPDGIPSEIAYGTNLHTSPFPGDNGIQFEVAKEEELNAEMDKD